MTALPRCKALCFALAPLLAALLSACAHTTESGEKWGGRVRLVPKPESLRRAFLNAALDPFVYVPAATAALLAIDDWDERVSEWAREKTPIFRSQKNARRASGIMRNILRAEAPATLLLTPSGKPFSREWLANKGKGALVEGAAYGVSGGMTLLLKNTVGRERPDGSDTKSFVSGHSSEAFTLMTLSNRNLAVTPMNAALRAGLQATNVLLASGTAWARVEGGVHFPTDVLVGGALGRFLTVFIYDAWLVPEDSFYIDFTLGGDAFGFVVSWRF